jgi:hypothetical protein
MTGVGYLIACMDASIVGSACCKAFMVNLYNANALLLL